MGQRRGRPLCESDRNAVGQGRPLDRWEVERFRRPEWRHGALDRRHLDVGAFGRFAALGLDIGRPFAGLELDAEHRTAQPFLHRHLDLRRGQRRIGIELLAVQFGVAGVELAFGKCRGLAAIVADLLERPDLAGHGDRRGARDLILGRPFGKELRDQFVEALFDHRRIDARLYRGADLEQANALEGLHVGVDADRDLFVADQDPVEARAAQAAKHRGADIKRGEVVGQQARHRPVALHLGSGDLVLHDDRLGRGQRRYVGGGRDIGRAAGNRTEIFLHQCLCLGEIDVAGQRDHRVVRAIFVEEPLLDVGQARRIQVGHRADGAVMVGMAFREQGLELLIFDEAARLVVALPLLVLDDAALQVEPFLGHRRQQITHPVGLHEQRLLERALGNRLVIIGAVEPGRPVPVGCPQAFEERHGRLADIVRPVEHQMLEQMGETGLALGLVLGPDIIVDGDGDDRRLMILVDQHFQAIVERKALIRHADLADKLADRCCRGDCRRRSLFGDRRWGDRCGNLRRSRASDQCGRGKQEGGAAKIEYFQGNLRGASLIAVCNRQRRGCNNVRSGRVPLRRES